MGRPPLKHVAVLGFGTMGGGIAQVCAQAGLQVIVLDTSQALLDAGRDRVHAFLEGGVRRGKLGAEDVPVILGRITGTTALADVAIADLVIEAVSEDLDIKTALLRDVAATVRPDAVLATNTSALSATKLASTVPEPQRFAGLHFFNPAPIMRLVEVVPALQTDDATTELLLEFVRSIGKVGIRAPDRPGFLLNRLLMPYLNDVVQAYDDGLASAEDIDLALQLGLGYPKGPLALLDLIGLDVHEHATSNAYATIPDPQFAAPPLLRRMVEAGYLGEKAGHGFRVGKGARA